MMKEIPGMESVIATVSGYHGTERFKLIKLIACTGASYVGAMAKSTTHLVCWQFEGKKYDLAKSFRVHIVSHRWFEDCLNEGKRLPESPYYLQCGLEVGPILLEIPMMVTHVRKENAEYGEALLLDCPKDSDERANSSASLSDIGNPNRSNSYCIDQHKGSNSYSPLYPLRRRAESNSNGGSNVSCESSRKRLRIKAKKAAIDGGDIGMLDSEHRHPITNYSRHNDQSNCKPSDIHETTDLIMSSREAVTTKNLYSDLREDCIEELKAVPCSLESNDSLSIESHNSQSLSCLGSKEIITDISKGNRPCKVKGKQSESMEEVDDHTGSAKLETSIELSCVICWTEFSSSRGVLSCGHRFCYPCIQEWADCEFSKGKIATCPLCKSSFTTITKVEDCELLNQKIYSQTIPCGSSDKDIYLLLDRGSSYGARTSEAVCYECHNHEPGDLLVGCHLCHVLWVHSCCLDPPLLPWTCIHCRDLRMLYQRCR